jgi:acetylornithine deacetylase
MGKVLVGLEELDRSLRSAPSHRLLGSGSLHASLISGGQELSSYPERCILSVERRTVPGETAQDVESQVRQILDQLAASDTAFNAALRTILLREAFEVSQNEPIVQAVRRHVAAIPGQEPGIIGATAWMDSAILSAAGIPTVIFGPGGEGAHAVVEWVDLEQVQRCIEVLVASAGEFCG